MELARLTKTQQLDLLRLLEAQWRTIVLAANLPSHLQPRSILDELRAHFQAENVDQNRKGAALVLVRSIAEQSKDPVIRMTAEAAVDLLTDSIPGETESETDYEALKRILAPVLNQAQSVDTKDLALPASKLLSYRFPDPRSPESRDDGTKETTLSFSFGPSDHLDIVAVEHPGGTTAYRAPPLSESEVTETSQPEITEEEGS